MKKKDFVTILLVSLFVVIVWITTDFIRSRPQSPIKNNLTELLTPIAPNLNQNILSQISELPPLSSFLNSSSNIPLSTPSPTPTASLQPTPQPTATNSSNITIENPLVIPSPETINIATGSAIF